MEASTRWLLDTLAEHRARATFFVVGEIAATHPQLVRDIADAGHEVGCHSWDHRRVHRFTPVTFREDVRKAKDALEQAAGSRSSATGPRRSASSARRPGRSTCWPKRGSATTRRSSRCGTTATASRTPRDSRSGSTAAKHSLLELPPATLGLGGYNLPAAGGGYFRLFPLAVMRAAVRQSERQPTGVTVLYFHPWEFDPDQPTLPLGRAAGSAPTSASRAAAAGYRTCWPATARGR